MIIQLLVNGVIAGCTYALVAFGFALVYNTTRTFHFAHGAVYTLSVYLFYTLHRLCEWPLWLSVVCSLVSAALLGILIDEIVYRPLVELNASPLIRMLSSLGAYIIIINVVIMFYGNEIKVLITGLQPTFSIGGVVLSQIQVLTALSCGLIFVALALLLRATWLGKVIRAMRDDPELVSVLGINPRGVRSVVFALGSALACVAAILKGLDVGTDPNAGMTAFLGGAVAVIIGGVGVFEGAILGALLVGVIQSFVVWAMSTRWQDTVTFLLLILFLLVRPEGILGRRRRIERVQA